MVLNGYTGKVADLLAESGQAVEESGLAGIGRTYDGNGSICGTLCFVLGARHRMARHRLGSLVLITEGRRADQGHVDVSRKLAAHGHLRPFDPIDPGITPRTAAFDGDFQAREKSQVHEMFGDGVVQFKFFEDGALTDAEVGQRAGFTIAWLLSTEYEVENHFQFHFYSNPFPADSNDQSHSRL